VTTNVPRVTWTPTGFVAPAESAILAGVGQDINAAFGGVLNFSTTAGSLTNPTPQGQLAASMAALTGYNNDTFLYYSTQTDPAYAEGRMQDAIGRIYFMERIPAVATTLSLQCVGASGTVIPVGAQVVDPSNNIYSCLVAGTIGTSGSTTIIFTANITGPIPLPPSVSIYQTIPGWDTAVLLSGTQGQLSESRASFENRRGLSTAANSTGSLPSILGAVLGVPGVTQAFVYENTTSLPIVQGGVTLAARSVYIAVAGGDPTAVATAIWTRKAPGCGYAAGNTTVTVLDQSPGYVSPFPSYQVTYQIPYPLPLLFAVSIVNSVGVPANATALVQQAIANASAGQPNALNIVDGPQSTIGAKIWASRFIPSVSALGTWAEGNVISLQIGSNNDADAASTFGYCNGTTLNVGTILSGVISIGQTLSVSNGSGVILPGTTIISQVSGSAGGAGVYTISTAQAFGQINLLLQSNTFSNASWSKTNSTVTGSAGTSPDGTNDSWTWQRSSTATAYVSQGISKPPSNLAYTFSIYAKPGTGSFLALQMTDSFGSSDAEVTFNVSTGVISIAPGPTGAGAFTSIAASITPSINGFYRCTLTAVTTTDTQVIVAYSGNSSNIAYNGTDTLSNTTLIVFGAQLETGTAAQTYIPTTTIAVTNSIIGFATPDQTSVQVRIDQIPTAAPGNVAVTFV
jgi:hypothetical protein